MDHQPDVQAVGAYYSKEGVGAFLLVARKHTPAGTLEVTLRDSTGGAITRTVEWPGWPVGEYKGVWLDAR